MGRTEFSTRNDYDASLGRERHFFSWSEMALFFECTVKYAPNLLDTADIVRDACSQHAESRGGKSARGLSKGAELHATEIGFNATIIF